MQSKTIIYCQEKIPALIYLKMRRFSRGLDNDINDNNEGTAAI